MAVILKPGGETVGIGNLTEPTHIVVGNLVGDEPAKIPEETVGHILAAHNDTAHHRDERNRVIAVGCLEILDHVVGPVLTAGFVAVLDTDLESLAVLGRDSPEDLSKIVVEMCADVLLAHLVGLQAGSLHRCRRTDGSGRKHGSVHHDPLPCRNIPDEGAVFGDIFSDVHDLRRADS